MVDEGSLPSNTTGSLSSLVRQVCPRIEPDFVFFFSCASASPDRTLDDNDLTTLPSGLFDGLQALRRL